MTREEMLRMIDEKGAWVRADVDSASAAIESIARISRENSVSIILRFNPDGSQEHQIEPWVPYTPMCPYGKEPTV